MHRLIVGALAVVLGGVAGLPALGQAPATSPAVLARRQMATEHRINELHAALRITPAQDPVFNAFAGVMRQNAQRVAALVDKRRAAATGSAVDQMHAYAELAQAHAEDLQRLVPAFDALYATLSPAQKALADRSFRAFAQRPELARALSR